MPEGHDHFQGHHAELDSPATLAAALTPEDHADVAEITRALYVGTGGDVTVGMAGGGVPVLFKDVPTGTLLPIRVKRLYATGTDAQDIVGLS